MNARRVAAVALTAITAAALHAPAAQAASPVPHGHAKCGSFTDNRGPHDNYRGTAIRISSYQVSCARARRVTRACLKRTLRGWSISAEIGDGDTPAEYNKVKRIVLQRDHLFVYFVPVDTLGCYRP